MSYSDSKYSVLHTAQLTGNDAATLLLTPQVGTGVETKTHTTTCEIFAPGKAITLKRLKYAVKTAQTGTGNNLTLNVYNGTTSVGTLAVTSTAANGVATQSADMDSKVAATGYVRIIALSTTTASDANSAIGQIFLTYQETYA